MNTRAYYESLSDEFNALKDRLFDLIGKRHWQSVGEARESVLRAVLRRHLPNSVGIGKGFVVGPSGPSTQIDVLVYDRSFPVLYHDGDMVVLTPDAVLAAVEVKTAVRNLKDPLRKLADVAELVRPSSLYARLATRPPYSQNRRFFGIFVYGGAQLRTTHIAEALKAATNRNNDRLVDCVCIGRRQFVRYWDFEPVTRSPLYAWRTYDLANTAPAYFIGNLIEALCSETVHRNNPLWFPSEGKETRRIGDDIPANWTKA